jgi:hypothetical protein
MDTSKARAAQKRGSPRRPSARTVTESVPASGSLTLRHRCPCCGHNTLEFTRTLHREHGNPTVLIRCWNCDARLEDVHAATGILRPRLLDWPPPAELGPPVERSRSAAGGKPEPLPGALVSVWAQYLDRSPKAWAARLYLADERGIGGETVRTYRLGYGSRNGRPDAFMLPVYDQGGELVALKERYYPNLWKPRGKSPSKTRNSRGEAHLYPLAALADDPKAIVLCEGEFDCLLLNQSGIPAVTSTAGTNWKPEWNRHVIGRQVAVLYDAGSAKLAERRARELVAAGARPAWVANLEHEGFAKGEDVTVAVVRYGWAAQDLRNFINSERRRRT